MSGDTSAFKTIIENTEGLVAQILFKMIPNSDDRKDIAQDVYLKTFQKLTSFRFRSKLCTWVGRIAYNTCLNYLEKRKLILIDNYNSDNEDQDETLEILNNKIDPIGNETEKLIYKKELSEILAIEIDNLSTLYRTLVTLYHNEDLSYSEISEITDLPEGTVKNYLFRARKTLRDRLLVTYEREEL